MGLVLTEFESGSPLVGDYDALLAALQERVARLQIAHIVHARRTIILFEGWEGSGKRSALRRLAAALDPCHFIVHCIRSRGYDASEQHWLAPYWSALPRPGEITAFYRSWYRRLIDDRVSGSIADKQWVRALDEANEFEAQQGDHGTLLIKLFFHVPEDVQLERLRERADHEWLRWTLDEDDLRSNSEREAYLAAWNEMFADCHTRWAPWRIIDGTGKKAARIAAMTAIADALEVAVPAEPPKKSKPVITISDPQIE